MAIDKTLTSGKKEIQDKNKCKKILAKYKVSKKDKKVIMNMIKEGYDYYDKLTLLCGTMGNLLRAFSGYTKNDLGKCYTSLLTEKEKQLKRKKHRLKKGKEVKECKKKTKKQSKR